MNIQIKEISPSISIFVPITYKNDILLKSVHNCLHKQEINYCIVLDPQLDVETPIHHYLEISLNSQRCNPMPIA